MTISDALPIQFWDIDDLTYNEQGEATQDSGINHFCFCQDWEFDDIILLQFQDSSGYTFYLSAITSQGELATNMPDAFTNSGGIHSLTVDLSSIGLPTYGNFFFVISRGNPTALVSYAVLAPSAWSNVGTAFDSKTATQFIENAMTTSRGAEQACVVPAGIPVRVEYTVEITGSFSGTINVQFFLKATSGGGRIDEYINDPQTEFTVPGTYSVTAIMEADTDAAFLGVGLSGSSLSGTPDVTITVSPGDFLSIGNIEKKSDCQNLYVADSDEENAANTNLEITYSNDSNVFGIDYESGSPAAQFTIRIPARFFHESFPQEEETHDLSSDEFITLWSRLERKKLLEIGYVPYFMHKKLQMILMHDNIAIYQEWWLKRDPYQIEEGNKRFPMKPATVLLTDKDTIERNLI